MLGRWRNSAFVPAPPPPLKEVADRKALWVLWLAPTAANAVLWYQVGRVVLVLVSGQFQAKQQ